MDESNRRTYTTADNKCVFVFFFQAEDGIRDWSVTGVQTCALPICFQAIELVDLRLRKHRQLGKLKVTIDAERFHWLSHLLLFACSC